MAHTDINILFKHFPRNILTSKEAELVWWKSSNDARMIIIGPHSDFPIVCCICKDMDDFCVYVQNVDNPIRNYVKVCDYVKTFEEAKNIALKYLTLASV